MSLNAEWHRAHPMPKRALRTTAPATNAGLPAREQIRTLLSGGDRRSIADSARVRAMVEQNPSLVEDLAALTAQPDWLVAQRALDLLEKVAHDHPEWVALYKRVFLGPLATSDKWEIRLQIVRALPLFRWTPDQLRRVEQILRENVSFPQTFVRAWSLDGLSRIVDCRPALRPFVQHHLRAFERGSSKALRARARHIRARLERSSDRPGAPARRNPRHESRSPAGPGRATGA